MSLAQAIFQRKWLVIIQDNNEFGPNGSYHIKAFGFKITQLRDIVSYLESKGLVEYKKGKQYKNEPSATRLFPEAKLVEQL